MGDYELLDELARGGMGVVYRARHLRLDRIVALKMILSGGQASSEERRRFSNESAAAARLQHPAIVPIYEVGLHEDQPFLAMAFIDGSNLRERLSCGSIPPSDAARLVRILADAVHYAHSQGVVHRDLKPANILLDADGHPHITDFGLAKQSAFDGELTDVGQIIGTPAYMSPEQATGKSEQVGPAADVYSLGAILYHALTGRPPFQAATAPDLIAQVRDDEPAALRRLNHFVPRDLEVICLKCLRKEPLQRYASAQRLAADLRSYEEGRPIEARPISRSERVWRICVRNPWLTGTTAVAVVSLLGGTLLAILLAREALRARGVAERAAESATRERDRANQNATTASQNAYAANMRLAQTSWQAGDLRRTRSLLDAVATGSAGMRGWEWEYQRQLLQPATRRLEEDPGVVFALEWSPEGSRIAAGTVLGVGLWDSDGKAIAKIPVGNDLISGVAFAHDGGILVAISLDGTIARLDPLNGRLNSATQKTGASLTAVAISRDGSRIVAGSADGRLWCDETPNWRSVWKAGTEAATVTGLDIDSSGERVAVGRLDGSVEIRVADTGVIQRRISPLAPHACRLRFLPNGHEIATTSRDGLLRIWNSVTGDCVATLVGHQGLVHSLSISADDSLLVSGGVDGTARLWRVADRSAGLVLRGHEFAVRGAAASPDGNKVVTSGLDAVTQIWSVEQPVDHSRVDGHFGPVTAIVPLRNRGAVLSVGHDGTLRRAEPDKTGDYHSVSISAISDAKNQRKPERLHSLVVDENEKNAWCGADHRIERYDISGDSAIPGEPLYLGENGPTKIAALALMPGGKLAFAGSLALSRTSRVIELVGRDNWKSYGDWTAREVTACDALATDPAERRIVAAGQNTSVPQWIIEPAAKKVGPHPPYVGHTSYVLCLAFHPKGTQLAAGAWDGTIRLWDTGNTSQPRVIFTGHRDRVHAVDFSPDGSRLLSASADGTIRVWDPGSGHELYSLAPQAGAILAAKFTRDGDQIIAGASDGTLRIFGRKRPLVTPSPPLDNAPQATADADWDRILTTSWEFGWTGGISNGDDETRASYYPLRNVARANSELVAEYDWQGGRIRGTLVGRVFDGSWTQSNGTGGLRLTFDARFQEATGWWNEGGNTPRRAAILRKNQPPGERGGVSPLP